MSDDPTKSNRIEETLSSACESGGEAAASAAEKVRQTVEDARASLGEFQNYVSDCTRECMHNTDVYVHENPWAAVAMAAGLGMIVGLLIGRR